MPSTSEETTFCGIPELEDNPCTICGQQMKHGEPVQMDWSGVSIRHINCEMSTSGQNKA